MSRMIIPLDFLFSISFIFYFLNSLLVKDNNINFLKFWFIVYLDNNSFPIICLLFSFIYLLILIILYASYTLFPYSIDNYKTYNSFSFLFKSFIIILVTYSLFLMEIERFSFAIISFINYKLLMKYYLIKLKLIL